jgi:hypothetical protein
MESKAERAFVIPCALVGAVVAGCAVDMDTSSADQAPPEHEIVVERGDKLAAYFELDAAREGFEDEPPLSPAERVEALSVLQGLGIDVSRARYFDNDWVIAEDVIHDARKLLREEQAHAEVQVDKGYWIRNATPVSNYQPIHLVGDPSFPLSWGWAFVVIAGATDWHERTNVKFTTDGAPPGATVMRFRQMPFRDFLGPGFECLLGLAGAPNGGNPGVVAINTTFDCTDPVIPAACRVSFANVSWDMAVHTMTHEIGHALGFAHPAESNGQRIGGTALAFLPNNPSYPSVMWGDPNGCFPGNANVTLGLSDDDVASAAAKYP